MFRLRKRAQSWLLILITVLFAIAVYGGFAIGTQTAGQQTANDLKEALQFNNVHDLGLSLSLGFIGGVMLIIVASGMMGNEFGWNTLRPLVARARSRASLITAKLIALLVYNVVFFAVVFVAVALLSIVCSSFVGADTNFSRSTVLDALGFSGLTFLAGLPTLALAFLLATWTRSNAAGIGGALGFTFVEPVFFALLGNVSSVFRTIEKYGINDNVQKLMDNRWQQGTDFRALVVLGVYTVVFVALSYAIFSRRDVTSG